MYHSLDSSANNVEAHFDLFLDRFVKKKPQLSELLAQVLVNAAGFVGAGAISGVFNTSRLLQYFMTTLPWVFSVNSSLFDYTVVKVGQRAENIKEATRDMGYAYVAALTATMKDSVSEL